MDETRSVADEPWAKSYPPGIAHALKVPKEPFWRLTDEAVADIAPGKDLPALTRTVAEKGLTHIPGLKPLFRLRAPKGGWRSTKKPFTLGGALGYRGRSINELVRRMM